MITVVGSIHLDPSIVRPARFTVYFPRQMTRRLYVKCSAVYDMSSKMNIQSPHLVDDMMECQLGNVIFLCKLAWQTRHEFSDPPISRYKPGISMVA